MVLQYRAFWSIPNAGPAMSTFHVAGSLASLPPVAFWAASVRALFNASLALIPNEVTISFDSEVTEIDTATGQLVGAAPVTPPAALTGGSSAAWAAGSGGRIVWSTNTIRNGRRVRGTTFMVPLHASSYTTTGVLQNTTITTLGTAASTYRTDMGGTDMIPVVYSRPNGGNNGAFASIEGSSVPSLVANLRSRKY